MVGRLVSACERFDRDGMVASERLSDAIATA
jgi:hypothetical protein